MNDVVVVTDSSACIPASVLQELGIPSIPLWVIWGDERMRDGVDITVAEFYQRLRESDVFPSTSQPSAGEFQEFFKEALDRSGASAIVGVFISSRLSGTVSNAQIALEELDGADIRVVDSYSASMGHGLITLAAARAASAGASADEVVSVCERVRDGMQVFFTVDTLEFLHRGGRIGGAKRLLGTALNIKPLLRLENGAIEPHSQVRTKRKAVAHMLEVIEGRLDGRKMAEASVLDVDSAGEGDALALEVRDRFGVSAVVRAAVSPVIGAHVGPGTVGVCYYPTE
jgi:DegV family protein with EDD domain